MDAQDDTWLDDAAGPVVRFYTLTGGRTKPSGKGFDLVAFVLTVEASPQPDSQLHPEHLAALDFCHRPQSVAELSARLDLPLGVLRIILSDLLDRQLIVVREPPKVRTRLPDRRVLAKTLRRLQEL